MTMRQMPRLRALPLLLLAAPLWAQPATSDQGAGPVQAAIATEAAPSRIGGATRSLLQRQREGREASAIPRAIAGDVAELSHQRYLDSFQQPLPPWFGSRLDQAEE